MRQFYGYVNVFAYIQNFDKNPCLLGPTNNFKVLFKDSENQ